MVWSVGSYGASSDARIAMTTTIRKTASPIHDVLFALNALSVARAKYSNGVGAAAGRTSTFASTLIRRALRRSLESLELPPRVHEAVRQIGQQIDQHDDERVYHHHSLEHRIVALVERADQELP